MTTDTDLGGSFTLTGTSASLNRMGYGAMQLAGPQVFGPPRDRDAAIAVLREAVAAGVNHSVAARTVRRMDHVSWYREKRRHE